MSDFFRGIFQTPLLVGNSDNVEIREKICKLALEFRENASDAKLVSEGWSYGKTSSSQEDFRRYGVTSFESGSLLDDPDWRDVMAFLYDFAYTMIRSVDSLPSAISFVNSWVTIYPPGTYVPEHIHSNSLLSGVFYAKVPEKAGNLIFKDPSAVAKTMCIRPSKKFPTVNTIHTHFVEEGQMVIFPSWLPHLTEVNQSEEDRIMVSFNIDVREVVERV
jgi:uncharacterized protein (TIGR02466 family)